MKHGILRSDGLGKLLAALVMALLVLVAAPGAAGAADGARADFTAQAASAGLNATQARSLQKRVDGYLASTKGTQIGANKIALPGGELLLALPGEQKARDLDAAAVPGDTVAGCHYSYVCAYMNEDFTGDRFDMFTCNHLFRITWNTTGSWINNQRPTLYARFYDQNKALGYTSPGGLSYDPSADWRWVWYVSPC
ncbi:peptidase inhibitor family I36 protein [Streptomyces sp. NPDC054961]